MPFILSIFQAGHSVVADIPVYISRPLFAFCNGKQIWLRKNHPPRSKVKEFPRFHLLYRLSSVSWAKGLLRHQAGQRILAAPGTTPRMKSRLSGLFITINLSEYRSIRIPGLLTNQNRLHVTWRAPFFFWQAHKPRLVAAKQPGA